MEPLPPLTADASDSSNTVDLVQAYVWIASAAVLMRFALGDRFVLLTLAGQLQHLVLAPAPVLLLWVVLQRRGDAGLHVIGPAFATVLLAGTLWPWFAARPSSPTPTSPEGAGEPTLSVVSWNLGNGIADLDGVAAAIRAFGADVVLLQETPPGQARRLFERLGDVLPHHGNYQEELGGDAFHKAFLSRLEPESVERVQHAGATSWYRIVVPYAGRSIAITSIHASKSFAYAPDSWTAYPAFLDLAKRTAAEGSGLLIGDLNTTERSEAYRRVVDAGLVDAFRSVRSGPGFTFPVFRRYHGVPLPPIVRIDFQWHAPDLVCRDALVLPHAGSDHHGLGARFARR